MLVNCRDCCRKSVIASIRKQLPSSVMPDSGPDVTFGCRPFSSLKIMEVNIGVSGAASSEKRATPSWHHVRSTRNLYSVPSRWPTVNISPSGGTTCSTNPVAAKPATLTASRATPPPKARESSIIKSRLTESAGCLVLGRYKWPTPLERRRLPDWTAMSNLHCSLAPGDKGKGARS